MVGGHVVSVYATTQSHAVKKQNFFNYRQGRQVFPYTGMTTGQGLWSQQFHSDRQTVQDVHCRCTPTLHPPISLQFRKQQTMRLLWAHLGALRPHGSSGLKKPDSQVTDSSLTWFMGLVTPPFPNKH